MEILLFIAFVIIILLLIKIKSFQKENSFLSNENFSIIKKELTELKASLKNISAKEISPNPTDENIVQWRPYVAPEIIKPPVHIQPVETLPVAPEEIIPTSAPAEIEEKVIDIPIASHQPYVYPEPAESGWQKWLRHNPDLEKFIGENLINKIGITVLVLGIAFFVKYAIDQDWIKEAGRVAIGIGCGILLTGVAHYLRNSYRSFSSVLAGGGIAVFYFTIAFAFHQYQLFSQTTAFVIMVVITIFAVLLSLLYDKIELAVIASVGGFITPFLVSTGSGNYIILFTYLLILNVGMLTLSWFKKWQLINAIALFFTLIIYGGWLVQNAVFKNEFLLYKNGLLFATAFYVLFLFMILINNIRTKQPLKTFDFSLLLLITFSYYSAAMTNLHFWNEGEYQGLFTIVLGALNFCLAAYFYKVNKEDKNLLYLLIGLTLTFVSLAVPIQLHGHTITLFWSAEFVLLYWLHQRSGISIFKFSSIIIMALMMFSLMLDWGKANDPGSNHLPVIYKNLQGFVTNIVAVLAFSAYALLLKRKQTNAVYFAGLKSNTAAIGMIIIATILFYLTCIFGVNLYFYNYPSLDVPNTWHQLITYLLAALLLWLIARYQPAISIIWRILLIAGCVCFYLLSIPDVIQVRNGVLQHQYPTIQLVIHWLASLVLLYLVYQAIALYRKNISHFVSTGNLFVWVINLILIAFFSVECMHIYIFMTTPLQKMDVSIHQYSKAGLTIVWALCSFTIMWLGMKHKYKTLRIISLVLFSIALFKLFVFDIRNISEGGKIAAFIMLGVLLLIISFMYQKLKKIIIDDSIR
jgi:uncharacterized membrane protein